MSNKDDEPVAIFFFVEGSGVVNQICGYALELCLEVVKCLDIQIYLYENYLNHKYASSHGICPLNILTCSHGQSREISARRSKIISSDGFVSHLMLRNQAKHCKWLESIHATKAY